MINEKLKKILAKADFYVPSDGDKIKCDETQIKKFRNYISLIVQSEKNSDATMLFRGTKLHILRSKLVSKLNSNNSLYDGLFLVGDKAKNYLNKETEIPHPIKVINSNGHNVASWIFDEYKILSSKIIETVYFQDEENRIHFTKEVKKNTFLIDYYLKGLHKWNSDLLVNFVSATSNFKIASSFGNDLVVILWMSKDYSKHVLISSSLQQQEEELNTKMLPVIKNIFEEEQEYSFKGFILPHYILGVYSQTENVIIINPALLENNYSNWIEEGFEIDNEKFSHFIKTTKYERFLTLYDNKKFKETHISSHQ